MPTVSVLGLPIADSTQEEMVDRLVDLAVSRRRPATAFAVHIGGLLSAGDEEFSVAMNAADLVYADGASAVLMARLAGAEHIERTPTTDLGWDLLRGIIGTIGRPARVAAIGGADGLSARALSALEDRGLVREGKAFHGYHSDWSQVLSELREHRPDVILVGLGAPLEMLWVRRHLGQLPDALILTCGGWFSFIVGDEPRAPRLLRRVGLEWLFRWYKQPTRLSVRYLRGLGLLPLMAARTAIGRIHSD